MKVKVRNINSTKAVEFTQCKFSEFHMLINFIHNAGGVYVSDSNETLPLVDWQLCVNNGECYAEIIVGDPE